jgi:hypothetical protein
MIKAQMASKFYLRRAQNAPQSFKLVLRMRHAFRLVVRLVVAGQLSRETSHFAIEMFVSK